MLYIPELEGKTCPQTGKPIDGCFIVGDVGSAIKGYGRFDLFTGECKNYSLKGNYCLDKGSSTFQASRGSAVYVVDRDSSSARKFRQTQTLRISKWTSAPDQNSNAAGSVE